MPKSRFKLWVYVLVGFLGFVFVSEVVVHVILFNTKSKLILSLEESLGQKISVGAFYYVWPQRLILKDVTLYTQEQGVLHPVLKIPELSGRICLTQVLSKGTMEINQFTLRTPEMLDYSFFQRNKNRYANLLANLPLREMHLVVVDGRILIKQKGDSQEFFNINLRVDTEEDALNIQGEFSRDTVTVSDGQEVLPGRMKGVVTKFLVSAQKQAEEFVINKCVVARDNFYLGLWGKSQGGEFNLKGYSLIDTSYQDQQVWEAKATFFDRVSRFLAFNWGIRNFAKISHIDHYLLDIDSSFQVDANKINIKRLAFSINQTPINLRGKVLFSDPLKMDLLLTAYPFNSTISEFKYLEKAELEIKGKLMPDGLEGNGQLGVYLMRAFNPKFSVDRVQIEFSDLAAHVGKDAPAKIVVGRASFNFIQKNISHRIYLESLSANAYWANTEYPFVDWQAPFYEGKIKGRLGINHSARPTKVEANVQWDDVNLASLKEFTSDAEKLSGFGSGQVNYQNVPTTSLKGQVNVKDGVIKDIQMLNWMKEYLDLDGFEPFNFYSLSGDIGVDNKRLKVNNLNLKNDKVELSGDFSYGFNDILTSKGTLAIDRQAVYKSDYFKPLLKIVDRDDNILKIDFQVSATPKTVNFQWSPSELKNKVQQRIPNFVERIIERRVETAVDQMPALN